MLDAPLTAIPTDDSFHVTNRIWAEVWDGKLPDS
ncbi:hypothetical protein GGQ85_004079 [Nitrobacter vulgaris]|nr:hypothetical protein [Nitrobacter vulgaris]